MKSGLTARFLHQLGRIRVRLLAVNLVVVLVPLVGLEFARVYERQLLAGLERDMLNQATLVRVMLEAELDEPVDLGLVAREGVLTRAAQRTRTRIRVVTKSAGVVADSHRDGPPEGPELQAPPLARGRSLSPYDSSASAAPEVPLVERSELVSAFAGARGTATRFALDPPTVFLFLAEPVRHDGAVVGAVYVTRSTNPVLVEMHRVRRSLIQVFALTLALTAVVTLLLALTISRPLERLARAAHRIRLGQAGVEVPLGGGGEIGDLAGEFAQMTRRLEARQRYISDFAADVAHEFKSPLTSIRGAAELLADGADDDPGARRRFLDNIKLDAARLDRLVSRLLELSRIDASEQLPQPVDLRALVARAARRAEGPDTPIAQSYSGNVTTILAREADVETALANLLDNAQRFARGARPVELAVDGSAEAGEVALRVTDDGPGVAPEHLPRLFDRFFTTDAERDGTGLGLAIVKSVAAAHGGSVSVQTKLGVGTTFELRLPTGFRAPRPTS